MDLFRKKDIVDSLDNGVHLAKCLNLLDLTFLGVGAIIGAGIFILTGIVAAKLTGPAIVISYVIAGLASGFAALSYAELAASVGGCGSAYGYAYVGFGELIAWIVGWDLLLEYAISVSAVSVGWSSYAKDILAAMNIHLPQMFLAGPERGGLINLPAFSIIFLLMMLLVIGVKSSSRFNNLMVMTKLVVISLFIFIAAQEFRPENWTPFMPFGWTGVMNGASIIFFAYVGFDAVSTAAEEAKNPQRDLPLGILFSLFICTFLYIVVSGLLTGIAHYTTLDVASPISHALLVLGHRVASGFVGVGAIAGLLTVMLVTYYGLTRVFYAMSRDGLLPKIFAQTNHYTKTPVRIIVLCGIFMSLLSAFVPIDDLAELVNIGTLFAFIIVCGGVIYLRYMKPDLPRPYKMPLMPYLPILGILSSLYLIAHLPWITMLRFVIWMVMGLIIYFAFSRNHSSLAQPI